MTETHELSTSRLIAAPPAVVYRVWTERTAEWFVFKPWTTHEVVLDLRPGGRFRAVMRGPGGEASGGDAVFLEVVPGERLVWTDAIAPGWEPREPFLLGVVTFEAEDSGTRYIASVRHWSAEAMQRHADMGFAECWGACADQLAELAEAEGA